MITIKIHWQTLRQESTEGILIKCNFKIEFSGQEHNSQNVWLEQVVVMITNWIARESHQQGLSPFP